MYEDLSALKTLSICMYICMYVCVEHNSVKKASLRAAGVAMRRRIFSLLGISEDRIVYGAVLAKTVYAPRGIKCNYPIAHAFEIRLGHHAPLGN